MVVKSSLHGLKAVAPLKPNLDRIVGFLAAPIHGLKAVAPLKLHPRHFPPGEEIRSPRPQSRGPVEASSRKPASSSKRFSPRPQSRGPVEAPAWASGLEDMLSLHGLKAVAPLKQPKDVGAKEVGSCSPRPQSRGPVEAYCMSTTIKIRFPSPRPQSRGPVEARVRPKLRASLARSPRPQSRGPVEAQGR